MVRGWAFSCVRRIARFHIRFRGIDPYLEQDVVSHGFPAAKSEIRDGQAP